MKDYTDIESGRLTLISYSRPGGKGIGSIWWASCRCGNVVEVVAKQVAGGRVKTCGNCGKGLGIHSANVRAGSSISKGHKVHFTNIIREIVAAGLTPLVTPDKYMALKGNQCVGCGTNETHVELGQKPRRSDPVNSTRLIPICARCSRGRNKRNVLEWLDECVRVAQSVLSRAGK